MPSIALFLRGQILLLTLATAALPASAAERPAKKRSQPARLIAARFEEPMVAISRACPGVVVDLRYATERNITGKLIYPPGARALLRKSVADRLTRAQQFVHERGFALKVWDAYRPAYVQRLLWNAIRNPAYVVEPSSTGSLHGWGAAVDVTLVDFRGHEVRMPTDFDAFSQNARYDYKGGDPEVAFNLSTLKRAMAEAGFRHIRDEWWHYSVGNEPGFGPIDAPLVEVSEAIARADADDVAKLSVTATSGKKKTRAGRLLFTQRSGETL